ncbi:MAG TPA: SEC-C metal-binding domain-containing protein [Vicinamibacterales bacterium]
MAKVGRNEPCPCSSGKKYKHCCEKKVDGSRMSSLMLVAVALAIVAAILASVFSEGDTTAGPGKVWSAEHGHYH